MTFPTQPPEQSATVTWMPDGSHVHAELTSEWVDGVQDRWESNGRRFTAVELDVIRSACRSLPVDGAGVFEVSQFEYRQRPTGELLRALDDDVEAGWELVIRVLCG